MSFPLPPRGSFAREACGDMATLAEILNPVNLTQLPTFRAAVDHAVADLAAMPAAKSINIVCLRANDERWLVRVGRRSGWKRLWNFGTGRQ